MYPCQESAQLSHRSVQLRRFFYADSVPRNANHLKHLLFVATLQDPACEQDTSQILLGAQ